MFANLVEILDPAFDIVIFGLHMATRFLRRVLSIIAQEYTIRLTDEFKWRLNFLLGGARCLRGWRA